MCRTGTLLALCFGSAAALSTARFPSTSADWVPVASNPVLNATEPWEDTDGHPCVCEPQVFWESDLQLFRMYYRGGWGTTAVGVADSVDGVVWKKSKQNPVYGLGGSGVSGDQDGGQPWVFKESNPLPLPWTRYWLFTTNNAVPRVNVATSGDGFAWHTVNASIALPAGGTLWGNRAVWKEPDGTWRLLQECGTKSGVWQVRGVNAWPVKRRGPLRPSALVAAQPLQPRNP